MNEVTDALKNEEFVLQLSGIAVSMWVVSLRIDEHISQLFEVRLVVRCHSPDLDLEAPIGRGASLRMTTRTVEQPLQRRWTGVCTHMALARVEPDGVSTYELVLRPQLWTLSQRTNFRLFQHVSVVDVARELLGEWEIEYQLRVNSSHYPVLELRTQYGESDHAFLSRLLEEAGICYFFEDVGGDTTMILCDAPQAAEARVDPLMFADDTSLHTAHQLSFATALRIDHRAVPATFASRDYDFRRPGLFLSGSSRVESAPEQRWEQYDYAPGGFLHERNEPGATPHADDKGPGRHDETFGNERTKLFMLRKRAEKRTVVFESSATDLYPGQVVRIVDHPHPLLAEPLLALQNTIERAEKSDRTTITVRTIPSSVPYHPPYSARKPRVEAVQTATVVGPDGDEIHTDEYGRVRVQFPWDRYGNHNEQSSCWMRVNQGWAGAGFGSLNLPRIGQDVLVAFLDGNPDHPIVIGRVFNETEPVPYKLPENKTVSTWKSNSSPTNGGFNEIRFEDAVGRELIYQQAEKDFMSLAKNNEIRVVGGNRSRLVRGHETETISQKPYSPREGRCLPNRWCGCVDNHRS